MLEQPFVNRMARALERAARGARARRAQRALEPRAAVEDGDAPFAVALHARRGRRHAATRCAGAGGCSARRGVPAPTRFAPGLGARRGAGATARRARSLLELRALDGARRSAAAFAPPSTSVRRRPAPRTSTTRSTRSTTRSATRAAASRSASCCARSRRRGHEVGLHGSYLSYTRTARAGRAEREQIDAGARARRSTGIRQHFLRFDVAATWRAQAAGGVRATTPRSATTRRSGSAPGSRRRSARGIAGAGSRTASLELPLTAHGRDPVSHAQAGRRRGRAPKRSRASSDRSGRWVGSPCCCGTQRRGRAAFPGWWACYAPCPDEVSRRGAWVAPAAEVAEWWQERLRRQAD